MPLKICSDSSQKPFESGFDDLKRLRPTLEALILAEYQTAYGSCLQYLITLLLKRSCADIEEWLEMTGRFRVWYAEVFLNIFWP